MKLCILLLSAIITGVVSTPVHPFFERFIKFNPIQSLKKIGLGLALDTSDCAKDFKHYVKSALNGEEWAMSSKKS